MKYITLTILLFASAYAHAQSPDQSVITQAKQIAELYKAGDHKGYIRGLHPNFLKVTGEDKLEEQLDKLRAQMTQNGLTMLSIDYTPPTELIESNHELQAILPQQTKFLRGTDTITTFVTVLGISADKGSTWKFIPVNLDVESLRKIHPNLSDKIIVPLKQKPNVSKAQ